MPFVSENDIFFDKSAPDIFLGPGRKSMLDFEVLSNCASIIVHRELGSHTCSHMEFPNNQLKKKEKPTLFYDSFSSIYEYNLKMNYGHN
jgi:hypothetical protein